jgi:succinyl-diaminopimelate desuccinylase
MVNKQRLIRLIRQLIQIDSQNPPGNEAEIAAFVSVYLKALGLKVRIIEFKKERSNLLAVLAGKKKEPTLLITPHLDTVPSGKKWHFNPLSGRIDGKRIYGLGATDCKGNLAAGIEAINSIVEERVILDYNLIFAATADEESGSGLGLAPLLEKGILKADQAVVLDADDFDVVVTQKGLIHLKVKIQGKRAHGAYPWLGVNAIESAVNIIKELKVKKTAYAKNKYLRPPTLNIGTIHGGDKVNVVADWCEFELDFRFLPGMSAKEIMKDLEKIIRRHSGKFKIEIEGIQEPYKIAESHPLVKELSAAIKKVGVRPVVKGSEGATTITFFQERNIPAVATGFGCGACAHTTDEYAKIDNLYKGARVLEEFLKHYRFD